MNFIKKVFMFLLVMVVVISQFDVAVLAASEYPAYSSIIERYFKRQDSIGKARTLRIGYDIRGVQIKGNYSYEGRFKFYNPYEGQYLTLNGTEYDDFSGQIDVNDPISLSNLGEKCWDHIVITTNPEQGFLDNKCLDTLFSLLREGGIITVPVWSSQINSLKDTFRLGVKCKMISWKCEITWEELGRLGDFLFSYNDVELCEINSDLLPAIKKAIKDIYKSDFDLEVICCCSAVYYKMQNMGFFLGNLIDADPYSPLGFANLRYIVTLRPI